jgi:MFS family permease
MSSEHPAKSLQQYIDESPVWVDQTPVGRAPLTSMQWRIWCLACAGKFFEGLVVFMTGVALPLLQIEFYLAPSESGLVGSATLFGILVGATALGGLADAFGRKLMFILEMVLFTVCLVLAVLAPNFGWFLAALFGMGLALGCDYPTAHVIISESIPSYVRGRLVLSAFGFQAVGALAGTIVGLIILKVDKSMMDWRWMYASAIVPAILVTVGRFFITQSGHWLLARGRVAEAERETERLLRRTPAYPKKVVLGPPGGKSSPHHASGGYWKLFSSPSALRATVLASVPWFLQDLGTYGIGIFTPTILASTIGSFDRPAATLNDVILRDMLAARGAAVIDILLIVGIVAAIFFADRIGRIKLQIFGFIGCAFGLLLAAVSSNFGGFAKLFFIFAGFMLFNFMTNLGPNAMTYLIAGEVFPTRIRGLGAGFAASFAKIGAVLTAFLFPILLKQIGTARLLHLLVATSLLGALVTWWCRIETTGVNLETIGDDAR